MGVANFTPDTIPWQHQGRRGTIKPGEIVTNRDRGWENHVLNKWGPRGLVKIEYNDDEEKLKDRSMEIFRDFWLRNIQRFNEQNEQQKNEGRQYTPPTKELQEKAELFDVELIGPWKLKFGKKGDAQESEQTQSQPPGRVLELETRVGSMEGQLNDIYGMLKQVLDKEAESGAEDKAAETKPESEAPAKPASTSKSKSASK